MYKYTKAKVEKIVEEKKQNLKETDPIKFYEQEGQRLIKIQQQHINASRQIDLEISKIVGKIELLKEQKVNKKVDAI